MGTRFNGRISVIVSTYNWPEALRAVLYGLTYQTDRNFEVIVAEDGTDARTRAVVDDFRRKGLNVDHVWQEHNGFRVAAIRNKAVIASSGQYLIFLDGDCIPREGFVAAHRRLAEHGYFVQGNRVMLREKLTDLVLSDKCVPPEDWGMLRWIAARLTGQVNRLAPLITLPLGPLRRGSRQDWKKFMACNLAMWKLDLTAIDGFDSSYIGWGWEDNDLCLRMLRYGVRRKTGRFATGVIHLFHHPAYVVENRRRFVEMENGKGYLARKGLSAAQVAFRVANGREANVAAAEAFRLAAASEMGGP